MFLFGDSFDHYATADFGAKGYSPSRAGYAEIGAYGRNSTNGLRLLQNNSTTVAGYLEQQTFSVSGNVCIVGMAIKRATYSGTLGLFELKSGGGIQVNVFITTSGVVKIRRGATGFDSGGTLLATSASSLTVGVWTHLQIKITVHTSTGTIDIKFDDVADGSAYGLTGLNTANTGSAGWNQLRWGSSMNPGAANNGASADVDDLVVLDASGSVRTDFLGDVRALCTIASAGNGTHTDWSCSTGTDRGEMVNEAPPNGATDYVSSGVSGDRVTFNFAALGVAGSIYAVQTLAYMKAQVAGVRYAGSTIRISSTDYDAAGVSIGSDWTYQREVHEESPATATDWTVSEIDGAEFGEAVTA